jgi:ABC-type methionine transport system ATPase subunit
MIKLSNITKVFQQGNTIQALNNVSLHVLPGKFMASSAHPAPVKVR